NGELFSERLRFAAFNRDMRDALLSTTRFNWSRISPAIFGALFQSVMEDADRRQIGAHYTSERDILKVAHCFSMPCVLSSTGSKSTDLRVDQPAWKSSNVSSAN